MEKNNNDKSSKIVEKINSALDKIRPSLQADGGDVNFIKWEETTGTAVVELTGHCAHCPMSSMTLKNGIEVEIKKAVPEVKEVVGI